MHYIPLTHTRTIIRNYNPHIRTHAQSHIKIPTKSQQFLTAYKNRIKLQEKLKTLFQNTLMNEVMDCLK